MEFLKTTEVAKLIETNVDTLRYWDNTGKFVCHHKTPGGQRLYSIEQVADFLGVSDLEVQYKLDNLRHDIDTTKVCISLDFDDKEVSGFVEELKKAGKLDDFLKNLVILYCNNQKGE